MLSCKVLPSFSARKHVSIQAIRAVRARLILPHLSSFYKLLRKHPRHCRAVTAKVSVAPSQRAQLNASNGCAATVARVQDTLTALVVCKTSICKTQGLRTSASTPLMLAESLIGNIPKIIAISKRKARKWGKV